MLATNAYASGSTAVSATTIISISAMVVNEEEGGVLIKTHRLYNMVNGEPIGVLSRKNFRLRQELYVFRTDTNDKAPVFHIRKKYDAMLYGSSPVLHPQHPLIVWPLTGSQILFGDLNTNQFFEQKTKIASKRG
jgi:hypothetical protein